MSNEKTIRYFVRFYNSSAYPFEFESPRSCSDLLNLMTLTEIETPSELLLMDNVQQDPEIEVSEYQFNFLINELASAKLEDCAYFQRSNGNGEIGLMLVLKVKPEALNRFVAKKSLPLTPCKSALLCLIDSVENLKEILNQG
jgi:hypothetical protein